MKAKSKALIRNAGTLGVIFLIFTMSLGPAFAKERKYGKELSIQKKDGVIIRGELIAVKNNSLLLNSGSSSDTTIDIGDVKAITIINTSHFGTGAGIGFLLGAGVGITAGLASKKGFFTSGQSAIMGGVFLGIIGGLAGGFFGALAGINGTIDINDANDPYQTSKVLARLRELARYPEEK